ncbi:hypothetical protein PR048_002603 [Dryococelus australis]|uniref:C2H2-type domain-containing protein n=1 Tax=Dryococelus australis TaxID=614101 RepID=A0ABQ9IKP6_9NEOP|nr:hypothetical protein PR048_002603 [Dryococelus australis]
MAIPNVAYTGAVIGVAVSPLASHQGEPGSIPGGIVPRFSRVGIVPDDAVGRRVFSGISRSPRPCIPTVLYTHLASSSSALKTSILLASHLGKQGSIPGRVTPRFSHVGIVLDYAAGRRVSSVLSFRRCSILTLIALIGSQALARHDGNIARLVRRSDEALGVRVTVARIAPSLLDSPCSSVTHYVTIESGLVGIWRWAIVSRLQVQRVCVCVCVRVCGGWQRGRKLFVDGQYLPGPGRVVSGAGPSEECAVNKGGPCLSFPWEDCGHKCSSLARHKTRRHAIRLHPQLQLPADSLFLVGVLPRPVAKVGKGGRGSPPPTNFLATPNSTVCEKLHHRPVMKVVLTLACNESCTIQRARQVKCGHIKQSYVGIQRQTILVFCEVVDISPLTSSFPRLTASNSHTSKYVLRRPPPRRLDVGRRHRVFATPSYTGISSPADDTPPGNRCLVGHVLPNRSLAPLGIVKSACTEAWTASSPPPLHPNRASFIETRGSTNSGEADHKVDTGGQTTWNQFCGLAELV